jgi:hypothetical protein
VIARVRNTANMAISSFNYLLLKQVMCHVTPGFPANPLPAVPIVLGREFGSRALGETICGAQDVIEQREGRFNLEAALPFFS